MITNQKWTLESLQAEALKYNTKKDFKLGSSKAYHSAIYRKELDTICKHMVSAKTIKWTKEKVLKEALKYNSRFEFQKKSKSAYNRAHKEKYLDEACKHMESEKIAWTIEALNKEALKYATRISFKRGSVCAYRVALREKCMDKICKHMLPVGNCYKRCVYELRAPGKVYVGLTLDFARRIRTHRCLKTLGPEGFKAVQLTDYLPVKEAIKIEKQLILLNTACKNLQSFNKHEGGGLGGGAWVKAKKETNRKI